MAPSTPLLVLAVLAARVVGTNWTIPNTVYDGPVSMQFTAGNGSVFDAPTLTPYTNDTTYEWTYFDVVSETTSGNESVVVFFYDTTQTSLGGVAGSPVSASIALTLANGSALVLPVKASVNESAHVETSNNGVEGRWGDTGFAFAGTSDRAKYTVTLDSAQLGVNGTVVMYSLAPARLPCGVPTSPSDTALVVPHVGWSNAVPGAGARVSLDVRGTRVDFVGHGYHDKNWGDIPFNDVIQWSYRGHAQLGPYTFVWFDGLATSTNGGGEHVSGYLARSGKVVAATCAGGVKVRPWGQNSEYPPTQKSGNPEGFVVEFDIGQGQPFMLNVSTGVVLIDAGFYGRYIGNAQGGVVGDQVYNGRALWEQFKT